MFVNKANTSNQKMPLASITDMFWEMVSFILYNFATILVEYSIKKPKEQYYTTTVYYIMLQYVYICVSNVPEITFPTCWNEGQEHIDNVSQVWYSLSCQRYHSFSYKSYCPGNGVWMTDHVC